MLPTAVGLVWRLKYCWDILPQPNTKTLRSPTDDGTLSCEVYEDFDTDWRLKATFGLGPVAARWADGTDTHH